MSNSFDLAPFCASSDDPREFLRQPFDCDGGIAATDGPILMIVPGSTCGIAAPAQLKSINAMASAALNLSSDEGEWIPVSDITWTPEPCEACEGTGHGRKRIDCDECAGEGYFWHGSHEYTCQECYGDGHLDAGRRYPSIRCRECLGSGEKDAVTSFSPTGLNGGRLTANSRYVRLLLLHAPGARLRREPLPLNSAIPILFDAGVGMLAPMRRSVSIYPATPPTA